MYNADDYFKILNFLKGDTVDDLDDNIKVIAKSEQGVVKNYFERVLDEIAHSSVDYARLKKFFIDWYASHRTLLTLEKGISDINSLPSDDVDELIRSYGFNVSADTLRYFTNKREFFLDLVNLYKVKGSPDAIIDVLTYYGLGKVDIGEYWLRKDLNQNLVFRGKLVSGTGDISLDKWADDVDYDIFTSRDPHWFLTKEQMEATIARTKFGLPDKSPYYSLRPRYDISAFDKVFAAMIWKLVIDYNTWVSTGVLVRDIKIPELNYTISFLELYVASVYTFNQTYNKTTGSSGTDVTWYDGTASTIASILTEYDTVVTNPVTRAERDAKIAEYQNTFTRNRNLYFLEHVGDAGTVLQSLNPDLKARIDTFLSIGRGIVPLGSLLRELDYWIQQNIAQGSPFLSLVVLGIDSEIIKDIKGIVNFFKPYRARLASVELLYVSDNPLMDSIRIADELIMKPVLRFDDYINWGTPCCEYPDLLCPLAADDSFYNRNTYDCGSYYDIGAAFDRNGTSIYVTDEIDDSRLICRMADGTAIVTSGFTLDSTSSEVNYAFQSGGFSNFDEEGVFDCMTGSDIVQITVQEVP